MFNILSSILVIPWERHEHMQSKGNFINKNTSKVIKANSFIDHELVLLYWDDKN